MAFSFIVEVLTMKKSMKKRVVQLNEPVLKTDEESGYSDMAH